MNNWGNVFLGREASLVFIKVFGAFNTIEEIEFRERSQIGLDVMIWKWLIVLKVEFAMRYSGWWMIGAVASMWQKS